MLVHGDAHPDNLLEDLSGTAPKGFKLIDPDAMASEPAHDLGIPLRDWSEELLDGDPVELGAARCSLLADLTRVDRRASWQWAFIERVSSGLFESELGDTRGRLLPRVAHTWVTVEL